MKRQAVVMAAPGVIEVQEEALGPPAAGEVQVETLVSAISAGTELLFYRGQVPASMALDETIPTLGGRVQYPLRYGYAVVGRVVTCGDGVDKKTWLGRLVFAFRPHESAFNTRPEDLIRVGGGIGAEGASFLPNMETALTLVHDGGPLAGEQVAVFGQGIVGLLVTGLLAGMPLASLVTLDRYALRRGLSVEVGAHASLDPAIFAGLRA